ncbi:MAG: TetR/AcrR family transcriptional regulator [Deferrisomatales bacterium]|nr:TetR/AcrR family transcriptional regulator [Deferrisomatales bacterium]
MIRRREEKARDTRNKIRVAATRLFARNGFHRTSMADIASAIGMTQGAVFHHYPTKDVLLRAVIERLSHGLEAYRDCVEVPGSSRVVGRVLEMMVEHFRREPEATICLAVLATEFAGSDEPILAEIVRVYDTFIDGFAVALAGHPKVRNPRAAAIAFVGAVQGGAIQGLLRAGDPPIEALADGCLDLLLEW